nr:DUF2934 domain-containing protein [Robbsia betulipollinis]
MATRHSRSWSGRARPSRTEAQRYRSTQQEKRVGKQSIEDAIRVRAYHLWEDDGRPAGRADEYWEKARTLVEAAQTAGSAEPAQGADAPLKGAGRKKHAAIASDAAAAVGKPSPAAPSPAAAKRAAPKRAAVSAAPVEEAAGGKAAPATKPAVKAPVKTVAKTAAKSASSEAAKPARKTATATAAKKTKTA